jgi:8-oxo-dGTP pyrophosphatase MutT (NUDIX family)
MALELARKTANGELQVYVNDEVIKVAEAKFGVPAELRFQYEIDDEALALVRGSRKHERSHDITMFIFQGRPNDKRRIDGRSRLAVIRKPNFPAGGYRAPSGGAVPGESIEAGAKREALEETGLAVELERYLLRIYATFTCGDQVEKWVTHIFKARAAAGVVKPIDTVEIEHAKCVTLDELQGPIRQILLDTGQGLFAYRVALTDATVEILTAA